MNTRKHRTERLSDAQMIDLLSLAMPSAHVLGKTATVFRQFAGMASAELLQAVRDKLSARSMDVSQAARLVGVSELTARRWFEISGELTQAAKQKLAGLCLLLSLADDSGNSEATGIARRAISAAQDSVTSNTPEHQGLPEQVVLSAFDVAGLAAVALHLALRTEYVEQSRDVQDRVRELDGLVDER